MLKKPLSIFFTLAFLGVQSCSSGGGSQITTIKQPDPPKNDTKIEEKVSPPPRIISAPEKIVSPDKKKFDQQLTEEERPSPETQVNSLKKITGALKIEDFDFISKEYTLGGLKNAAFVIDSEFPDLNIDYTTKSIADNTGLIGFNNVNVTMLGSDERSVIIEKLLKQIFIFTIRSNLNRIIRNYQTGLAGQDKFSTEIANSLILYFNGSNDGTISENSLAKMSQSIDQKNALTQKIQPAITNGINRAISSAKTDLNGLKKAKKEIEIAFFKMLYLAVLDHLAEAGTNYQKKDLRTALNNLTAAEQLFLGLRETVKTKEGENNTLMNRIVSNRSFSLYDYNKFEALLNYGLGERVNEEMQLALKNISLNNAESLNSVISGQLYLDIITSPYLNSQKRRAENSNLKNEMKLFSEAIKNKKAEEAGKLLAKIQPLILQKIE